MRIENHEPSSDGNSHVVVSLHFDPKELKTTNTPFGVIVKLANLKSGGEPGAPALPRTQLKVAIPEPFWPGPININEEKWECVSDPATLIVPAQDLHAGGHCATDCSCRARQRADRPPLFEGLPPPHVTPPNPGAYAELAKNPPPIVSAVRIETIGTTHIAIVQVEPLRIGKKGELELCTRVRLTITSVKEPETDDRSGALAEFKELYGGKDFDPSHVILKPGRFISGLDEATRLRDIAIAHVINPNIVGRLGRDWPIIELRSDYLIITDDFTWNAETITPGVPRPGLIAAFERLADAKRARGITARVVTITDIVAGRHGDARTGSRDLQEVIRRFLKLVRKRWGVNWLLLGGDTSILPVRQVAGSMRGYVGPPLSVSPPADNTSYWTGTHLNIHAVNLGDWWGARTENQLVRPDTGRFIPYDSTGSSSSTSPGWYFTTGDDYATRSATATDFVRVEGPATLLQAQLQFLYTWNVLPTDFYYASLESYVTRRRPIGPGGRFTVPYVYVPPHDWDAIGNGIYGQHKRNGDDIDGVVLQTDLSVGRAPIENAAEATTFVDKILAYEKLGRVIWRSPNSDWPRKMLIAAADWWSRSFFWPTTTTTPGDGQFFHDAVQSRSLLKMAAAPTSFEWEVVARVNQNDVRLLPFKRTSSSSVRGWYFATSATDSTPSQIRLPLPWGPPINWPIPSQWIVVHGSLEERTPERYDFNPTGAEGSMTDQDLLRKQVQAELPGINRFDRLYEDEFDLPLSDQVAAPLDFLTDAKLSAALNTAPHFVSLSGHGSWDGCCGLSRAVAASLTNGPLGFIAYADSCLTNRFEIPLGDAMSEELIKNPNGGAVAYIGNTRFSWVGLGDEFQRAFFHQLTATRNLGLLNDSRLLVPGTTGQPNAPERWQIFTLNLLGDPELRVYRGPVRSIVLLPEILHLRKPFIRISTRQPIGPPTPGDPSPLGGVLVHVRQGKQEFSGLTDDEGLVNLPEGVFEKGDLEVTASHKDYAVTVESFLMDE